MPIHRHARRPLLRLTLIGLLAAVLATAVVVAGAVVVRFDRQDGPTPTLAADEPADNDRAQRASRDEARSATPPSPSAAPQPVPTQAPAARTTKPAPIAVPTSCAAYTGNRQIGCALLDDYGFSVSQMGALDKLWTHESGWNHRATNPYSGAYGIPQALPGSKMGTVAADWRTNPATQIKWGLGYIRSRYGTPAAAWSFWQSHNWY